MTSLEPEEIEPTRLARRPKRCCLARRPSPNPRRCSRSCPSTLRVVGIVMGAKSDLPTMEKAEKELTERGIRSEIRVMSAHHDPDVVADYARNARMRGLRVIIAGAGLGGALPGVVAAHTDLPVIGVPLTIEQHRSAVASMRCWRSPRCRPESRSPTVGVDAARNAAVLAARILGI